MRELNFREKNSDAIMCGVGVHVEQVDHNQPYILAYIGSARVVLVNTQTGMYWANPCGVTDIHALTWEEWQKVTDDQPHLFVLEQRV
jgi:hypothetical protein